MPIPRSVMVFNGKGGVGKTSAVANIGGIAAQTPDWRVGIVGLDVSDDLSEDLGCVEQSDDGQGLLEAALHGTPLVPIRDVRPGLDLVPGGEALHKATEERILPTDPTWLRDAVLPLAKNWHLTLIDTPPGNAELERAAACAAQFVLIPTKIDNASLKGFVRVVERAVQARNDYNPDLEILGIVLTLVPSTYTRIVQDARDHIAEILGDAAGNIKIYQPFIRHTLTAGALGTRNRGLLAYEYEQLTRAGQKRRRGEGDARDARDAARGLADDYQFLTDAVLRDVLTRLDMRSAKATVAAGG